MSAPKAKPKPAPAQKPAPKATSMGAGVQMGPGAMIPAEDVAELLAKNRELEAIVRRKEATIQQLLKEAREDEGLAVSASAESDAHMKDRIIARLRQENAELKKKLAKKDKAVRSLVESLNAMQSLREDGDDEEPEDTGPGTPGQPMFRPPSRRAEAPTPTVPRAPAPSPASVRPKAEPITLLPPPGADAATLRGMEEETTQLNSFISDLTTRFDGLENELKEKTQLLAELQREEEEAKAEHAALLAQLHAHEAHAQQVRAGLPGKSPRESVPQKPPPVMVPPPQQQPQQGSTQTGMDEAEEELLEMQNKVNQLQAMLQMLGGDIEDMDGPGSPPRAPAPPSVPNGKPAPRGAPPADLDDPLVGLTGLGGLGDALSGLEEKKRKIEQLAAMLNINLDQ